MLALQKEVIERAEPIFHKQKNSTYEEWLRYEFPRPDANAK